jgi:RNA polymerase sigma-70 factor, ECF subfamily
MQAIVESAWAELQDFNEVVRLYWHSVYRFILASLRNADAAQSLTQDCFLRSYRNRGSFRGQASVKTWLMKIAVNLVHDYNRNRRFQFWKRLNSSDAVLSDLSERVPDAAISPECQALLNEKVQAIWQASRNLPERQRTVFLLRFMDDMDILEIAASTGMKEGTVKINLFRAIHTIRKRLGRLE